MKNDHTNSISVPGLYSEQLSNEFFQTSTRLSRENSRYFTSRYRVKPIEGKGKLSEESIAEIQRIVDDHTSEIFREISEALP